MRIITYLTARYINRKKRDKTKRIFSGKLVYLTSSNKFEIPSGSLMSIYSLMRNYGWNGCLGNGILEAMTVEEFREWIKKEYGIETFVFPMIKLGKVKYGSMRMHLESGKTVVDKEIETDSYEDAMEKSCILTIRDNKDR